jgi:ribose transport system ATP-binding protein
MCAASPPRLEVREIRKAFAGIPVLKGISLSVGAGEVMALLGENGAGKSTLMRIVSGAIADYEGDLSIDGEPVRFAGPKAATNHGVAMIYQELNLVPGMTAADNIFLGHPSKIILGIVDQRCVNRRAQALLDRLDAGFSATARVESLRVGEQQVVEIAKALALSPKILIMDEPTSALSDKEAERLFRIVRTLQSQDVAILYISHRMDEIFALASQVAVLRDGQLIRVDPAGTVDRADLIRAMVGREVSEQFAPRGKPSDRVVLEVDGLYRRNAAAGSARRYRFSSVSFKVREGEIFGLAGLLGAGRTEILETLFGASPEPWGGSIRLEGRDVRAGDPRAARDQGLALITEDRKASGLVLNMSIESNLSLPSLQRLQKLSFIRRALEGEMAERMRRDLRIRCAGLEQPAEALSGGNQQKVVLGKWLALSPRILLLDEPTRGIDVGSKGEIYDLLARLTAEGIAVVLVSSDLPELIGLCDRMLVLCEGVPKALIERTEFSQELILNYATPHGAHSGGLQ